MRRILLAWLPIFFFSFAVWPAEAKVPGDFKLVYRSSAGKLERATQERVEVVKGVVTVSRYAQVAGESEGMTQDNRTYRINDQQLEDLYQIVTSSGFMAWKKTPEASHPSQVNEVFEITADGRTVSHDRWESGNEEAFRNLFARYNSWFNGIRTVRF